MIILVEVWLPYGMTEVAVKVPNENLLGVIDVNERVGVINPFKEVDDALEDPLGTPKLDAVVKSGETVAIVVDNKTRSTSTRLIISSLLKKLNQISVQDEDITIIFGYGIHTITEAEGLKILGETLGNRINIQIHDCFAEDLEYVGKTSFGTKVSVNKTFLDADLKILTGDIALHDYAGYSGGRKSILPAITGIETIQHNHALLLDSKATTGNLDGNPVHLDMEEALHLVDVDLALNVVQNSQREVVKAFAGDVDKVFQEGVQLLNELCMVPVETPAEIVVVSPGGSPFDIDLYQAYMGIDSALKVVKNKGVVVLVAECLEGYSNKTFHDWMVRFNSLSRIRREIRRNFLFGGHKAYYLLKALGKVKIILVSVMPDYYAMGVFKLRTAKTVNAALKSALRMTGRLGKILVLPHGSTTLPVIKKEGRMRT
ncbi:nickel-dependent lactate racemase [Candidatus Bathyarchaeota archaeon]|nr:MAG: nickel-dependent lactate racemase [Candidatus Bathyarchaeota archaeon]